MRQKFDRRLHPYVPRHIDLALRHYCVERECDQSEVVTEALAKFLGVEWPSPPTGNDGGS